MAERYRGLAFLAVAAVGGSAWSAWSASPAGAALTHRYSFNPASTTGVTVADSVGGANATLFGGATVGTFVPVQPPDGVVVPTAAQFGVLLNNSAVAASSAAAVTSGTAGAQFVQIPANVLPATNATIEMWFQLGGGAGGGVGGYYDQAWSFSNKAPTNAAAPNVGPSPTSYLLNGLSVPANPTGSRVSVNAGTAETNAYAAANPTDNGGHGGYLDTAQYYMTAAVVNGTAGTVTYYINGVQQTTAAFATPLSTIGQSDNFLGLSPFAPDPSLNGAIQEFRIYNVADSAAQVSADFAAGANAVPEPATAGLLAAAATTGLLARRRRPR